MRSPRGRGRATGHIRQLLQEIEATRPERRSELYGRLAAYGEEGATLLARDVRDETSRLRGDGWAPTDILHVLKRRQSALHSGVAAYCMTQDDGLAAAASDPVWAAQLAACVDVAVPPSVATLQPLHEALCELRRLPPIHRASDGNSARGPARGLDDALLAKVRALLAKAESTDFPAEAEALTAKAQQLIASHALDRAALTDEAETQPTASRRVLLDGPYLMPKALLVGEVARANRCVSIVFSTFGFCTIFGSPDDLEATELLVASLLTQAVRTMTALEAGRSGRSRVKSFRHSFLQGFAGRIGERLNDAGAQALSEADPDGRALPVLASREIAAQEAATAAIPATKVHRSRVSNGDGLVAGRVAADRATLAPKREKVCG